MSREDYSAHSDMASRANKSVVLKATDSRRVLRDYVRKDQLSVTRCTVHRSHSLAERPPIVTNIEHFMRKEVPEIGWGDFEVIDTPDRAVLILRYDWRNNSALFVHNLDNKPREISFAAVLRDDTQSGLLVNLLGDAHSRAGEDGKHHFLIEAYGYRWFRVGGLDSLLTRGDIGV